MALTENGEAADTTDGLYKIAKEIAYGLMYLGNGSASTSMGAIEAHGVALKETGEKIADAIRELADAIRETGGR